MLSLRRGGWPHRHPPNCSFRVNRFSPQANGLIAWWPLGLGQYGMIKDVLGRWHMTAYNTPAIIGGERGLVTLFDGSTEHLHMASAPVTAAPFTVSAWVKLDQIPSVKGGFECAISLYNSGALYYLALVAESTNDYLTIRVSDSGGVSDADTTIAVSAGVWQHWCGIEASSTDRRVFLNGGNKGTNTTSRTPSGIDGMSIGCNYTDSTIYAPLDGGVADVRLYNRVLSDAEVWEQHLNPWELIQPLSRFWAVTVALTQACAGTLTSAGAITRDGRKPVAGTLTDAGAVVKQTAISDTGALTSAGALVKRVSKPVAGALTSAGAVVKQTAASVAGALTSAGAVAKQAVLSAAGTLTSSGTLAGRAAKALAGALTSAGAIAKKAAKPLTGALTSSGTVASVKEATAKAIAGTLALAGTVSRRTGKGLAGVWSAAGAWFGAIIESIGPVTRGADVKPPRISGGDEL